MTKMVPRSINAAFNQTLIIEDLSETDRLKIIVTDVGLLQEAHLGGFGPQQVAKSSLALEDFSGWLEMEPVVEVPNNGWPVLQIELKIREAASWPSKGFASDRAAIFKSDARQALSGEMPSAPPPDAGDDPHIGDAETEAEFRRLGDSDNESGNLTPDPRPTPSASSSMPNWPDFRWQVFHVDPKAWTFAQKGELLELLETMSMRIGCVFLVAVFWCRCSIAVDGCCPVHRLYVLSWCRCRAPSWQRAQFACSRCQSL